jgi:FAD/FMN-containing dehydrogenase
MGHHHGVGKHRVRWMEKEHGSSYALMEPLKRMFDPKGIMNPGSLIEL